MTAELMTPEERAEAIKDAMYRGDTERLHELAPCGCCCDEHYFVTCPAHVWMGCRGSYAPDRAEQERRQAEIEAEYSRPKPAADLYVATTRVSAPGPVLSPDGPTVKALMEGMDERDLQG